MKSKFEARGDLVKELLSYLICIHPFKLSCIFQVLS